MVLARIETFSFLDYLMEMNTLLTREDLGQTGWNPPLSWFVSRVCWREVGRILPMHPEVLEETSRYLDRVLVDGDHSCSPHYIRQWQVLVDKGLSSVVEVLVSPDDNVSQVMRSCCPLPIRRLLSQEKREEIVNGVKRELRSLEGGLG